MRQKRSPLNRLPMRFALSAIVATLLLAVSCAGVQTQEKSICVNDDGKIAYVGQGVTTPRLLSSKSQGSGSPLKGKHRQETVSFDLIIGSDGQVCDARIFRSSTKDTEFNDAALTAVKELKFDPARKKDKPVAVQVILELNLDLYASKEGRPVLRLRVGNM